MSKNFNKAMLDDEKALTLLPLSEYDIHILEVYPIHRIDNRKFGISLQIFCKWQFLNAVHQERLVLVFVIVYSLNQMGFVVWKMCEYELQVTGADPCHCVVVTTDDGACP